MKQNDSLTRLSIKAEYWTEIITWAVMILVLIFIKLLPNSILDSSEVYLLIGGIVGFILIYYLIIYRYFTRTERLWIKDISDIIIISVLIILARDYGIYFFALYFLPVAAATLVLGSINSLLIALIASLFVILDIFLGSQGILPSSAQFSMSIMQISFIILISIFCRFLALQIREEKHARIEAETYAKAMGKTEKREREFMIMTSHQLMTPLSIIRGFSSLLYTDEKKHLDKKQFEYSKEIYLNTKRMVGLVNELMSISKMRSQSDKFKLERSPIGTIIDNVMQELLPYAKKKKIILKYDKPAEKIPDLKINSVRLEQAIYNLVDNAIKYTPHGSVIVSVKKYADNIIVSVEDSGKGIAPEDNDKIFTPFFRGKNVFQEEGTGLGVYIAKMIIEKHGGRIWFESVLEKGTTFKFSLPVDQAIN